MLFRFFRQYFKDDEFEQTKIQLIESQNLLVEYKNFIQKEKERPREEEERVDSDFLVMIWASIGLALSIGVEAVKKLPKSSPISAAAFSNINVIVWLIIALYTVMYVIANGMFALELTRSYAKSKVNGGYKVFAVTLIIGVAIVFVGIVLLAQFGNN